jgi:hypothetical protein
MRVSGQLHAPALLYPWGKDPRYHSDRRLGKPQSWSEHRGKRKNNLPLLRIEARSSSLYVDFLFLYIVRRILCTILTSCAIYVCLKLLFHVFLLLSRCFICYNFTFWRVLFLLSFYSLPLNLLHFLSSGWFFFSVCFCLLLSFSRSLSLNVYFSFFDSYLP